MHTAVVRSRLAFPLLFALALAACGAGAGGAAQAVRPSAPTAADALGAPATTTAPSTAAACAAIEAAGEPLIVDWSPDQRIDLEVMSKDALPVVAYSCHGLKVLKGCSVEGGYAFKGVTPEEQVVRLQDADEIRANLPLSGASLVASMGGDLERGATLDLALAYVGKSTSTVRAVTRSKLSGDCDGATHFVHGMTVGAFAMQTGSRANVSTAVQIFGAGAGGASTSSRVARVESGNLDACRASSPDAKAPPEACRAVLRLDLWKIAADGSTPAPAEEQTTCPEGLVESGGKCTRPDAAPAHVCAWGDPDDCKSQCDKGDGTSCYRYGRAILQRDPATAEARFATACDANVADGCQWAGLLLGTGRFAPAVPADQPKAVAFYQRGCDRGSAAACFDLGSKYQFGQGVAKDEAKAAHLYDGACSAGDDMACVNLGLMTRAGTAVAKDSLRAAFLFERACQAGSGAAGAAAARGCRLLGEMLDAGEGVAKDAARAKVLYQRACDGGEPAPPCPKH
jgi:hypothetical protein